jgi:hypothetical protein
MVPAAPGPARSTGGSTGASVSGLLLLLLLLLLFPFALTVLLQLLLLLLLQPTGQPIRGIKRLARSDYRGCPWRVHDDQRG